MKKMKVDDSWKAEADFRALEIAHDINKDKARLKRALSAGRNLEKEAKRALTKAIGLNSVFENSK